MARRRRRGESNRSAVVERRGAPTADGRVKRPHLGDPCARRAQRARPRPLEHRSAAAAQREASRVFVNREDIQRVLAARRRDGDERRHVRDAKRRDRRTRTVTVQSPPDDFARRFAQRRDRRGALVVVRERGAFMRFLRGSVWFRPHPSRRDPPVLCKGVPLEHLPPPPARPPRAVREPGRAEYVAAGFVVEGCIRRVDV